MNNRIKYLICVICGKGDEEFRFIEPHTYPEDNLGIYNGLGHCTNCDVIFHRTMDTHWLNI